MEEKKREVLEISSVEEFQKLVKEMPDQTIFHIEFGKEELADGEKECIST